MADNYKKPDLCGDIRDLQIALKASGNDPSWKVFEQTYNWFLIRKKLSMPQQDHYQELWIQQYNKAKGRSPKNLQVNR